MDNLITFQFTYFDFKTAFDSILMTLDINEDKHTFNIRLHVSGQFFFFLEVNMIVKIDQMSLILGYIPSI